MQDNPTLISEAHATMALGLLGARIDATRRDSLTNMVDFPEPAELLALWEQAVADTADDARRDLIRDRRNRRELKRSVEDVTDGGREPTATERAEIEAISVAHYETYQRITGKTADWDTISGAVQGVMMATIADMVRAGVIVPGPTTTIERSARWGVFDEDERQSLAWHLGAVAHERAVARGVDSSDAQSIGEVVQMAVEAIAFFGADYPIIREGERMPLVLTDTARELGLMPPAPSERSIYVVFTNLPGPGVRALIEEAIEGTDDHTPLGQVLGKIMAAAGSGCEFVEVEDADGNGAGETGLVWDEHSVGDGVRRLGPFRPPAPTAGLMERTSAEPAE